MSTKVPVSRFSDMYGAREEYSGVPPHGMTRSFVNNVRLRIQSQMRTKIHPEQKRGRLYKRALVRPLLPPVDGGEWNRKIFYRRAENRQINTAVTVLVDVSGSMSGNKIVHASMATCLLVNALSKALRVPCEVLCFAFSGRHVTIGIVKDFNTPVISDEEIAGGICSSFTEGGGGNDDANALLFAYERLLKRKERNRILIVLSDGSPADSPNGSDPDSSLKYVVETIRKRNEITLHGIGIMHPNVMRYYGDQSSVIRTPDDLERALIETLGNKVLV